METYFKILKKRIAEKDWMESIETIRYEIEVVYEWGKIDATERKILLRICDDRCKGIIHA